MDGGFSMEFDMLKELLNLAVKNPSYIIPSIILFVIFLVLIAGKYRAKILDAIFDKIPWGKKLEQQYEKKLKEELEELKKDNVKTKASNDKTTQQE